MPRPDLAAAYGRTIPDVLRPGLRVWPALHRSGFTPRQFSPSEQEQLLPYGLGITNLVARGTATAAELGADELRAGGRTLAAKLADLRPGWLAVLGVTAYRQAFGPATLGPQPAPIAGVPVWVLPNPSGLNAHYTVDGLAIAFAELRAAL
jgi:double-stranded uracil-DNA glycosylase